jgi:hypothetical protein
MMAMLASVRRFSYPGLAPHLGIEIFGAVAIWKANLFNAGH